MRKEPHGPQQQEGSGEEKRGGKSGEGRGAEGRGEQPSCLVLASRVCSKRREASYGAGSKPLFVSVALFDHNLEFDPLFQRLFYFCGSALNW